MLDSPNPGEVSAEGLEFVAICRGGEEKAQHTAIVDPGTVVWRSGDGVEAAVGPTLWLLDGRRPLRQRVVQPPPFVIALVEQRRDALGQPHRDVRIGIYAVCFGKGIDRLEVGEPA